MDDFTGRGYDSGSRGGTGIMMFAIGAAVGAAVALMLAPAKGTDTRAYLGRRGRKIADDVTEQGKKLWDEHGERVVSAVQRGYDQAAGAVSDRVNGATDSGQPM
jgi:gas vesicle protein